MSKTDIHVQCFYLQYMANFSRGFVRLFPKKALIQYHGRHQNSTLVVGVRQFFILSSEFSNLSGLCRTLYQWTDGPQGSRITTTDEKTQVC